MNTKTIIIALLSIALFAHIGYDIYFYYHYLIPIEDRTKDFAANSNSYIVESWTGKGERLVNDNKMRSETFQKIYSSDFMKEDSLVLFLDFNNKMGVINSNTMKIVVEPEYDQLGPFSNGLAFAVKNEISPDLYGFIDLKGWHISPGYQIKDLQEDHKAAFGSDGFCRIPLPDGKVALINRAGRYASKRYSKILFPMNSIRIIFNNNEGWGAIKREGNKYIEILKPEFNEKFVMTFIKEHYKL